jgi:small acid-soluble spore protein H (minor)
MEMPKNNRIITSQGGITMLNTQRAQEIAASPIMANVTYQEVPIYIQHVDEQNETARIYPLDNPELEQDVPLSQLMEH